MYFGPPNKRSLQMLINKSITIQTHAFMTPYLSVLLYGHVADSSDCIN